MKIGHLLAASAVALGAVTLAAAPAQAHPVDVVVVTGFQSCPAEYREIAQVDTTATICVHVDVPEYKVVVDGSPCAEGWWDYGWREFSVLDFYRVCVRL